MIDNNDFKSLLRSSILYSTTGEGIRGLCYEDCMKQKVACSPRRSPMITKDSEVKRRRA